MAFNRVLWRIRTLVRASQVKITTHAEDEMVADGLLTFDVEHCILTGEIAERQQDYVTGQWKYVIEGMSISGENMATVARIGPRDIVYIVTVFKF